MRKITEAPEYKGFVLIETKDSKNIQIWGDESKFPQILVITNSKQEILFVIEELTGGYMEVVSGG